ncbi:hypothetical protein HWC80_gp052 [Mycobacterium phage Indlulamithi]|uniref:Uncharacterized protein n=1 Tax=Mycobacterium phage Indlulamithi TaxID=2656582 RepID=A0A649VDR2_9CAUD|nr:hypothetical protein HWC80_gp052 [Mycobacterium phage Indlulamithi]QGJ90092.1 hypothetical protein PBI_INDLULAMITHI_52 [Mycobacterium phage Indlulamithi]
MAFETRIRNRNTIEKVNPSTGHVIAKAVRAQPGANWHVGAEIQTDMGKKMTNVGEIAAHLPEVMQRKLALSWVDSLPFNLY